MILGQPFTFSVRVDIDSNLDTKSEAPIVKVSALRMLLITRCRFFVQGQTISREQHSRNKLKPIVLHPVCTGIDLVADGAYRYAFQATLSSYFPPTFTSFLISTCFMFDGCLELVVNGQRTQIDVESSAISVTSAVVQQVGLKSIANKYGEG
jgi:hypothetical protein